MAVNQHLVAVRRFRLDRYGDRQTVATFQVAGCVFAPRSTSEDNDRSTSVETDAELFVPPYAGIEPSDEIDVDGVTYQVAGRPERWQSPFNGWNPGEVVPLKRITG